VLHQLVLITEQQKGQEADETLFWLEIIKSKKWIKNVTLDILIKEANELTAIFVSTLKAMNKKINIRK